MNYNGVVYKRYNM